MVVLLIRFRFDFSNLDLASRWTFYICTVLFFAFVGILTAGSTNHVFREAGTHHELVVSTEVGHSDPGRSGVPDWFLHFDWQGKHERIKVSRDFALSIHPGDKIDLTLVNGALGYPIIIEYRQYWGQ